MSENIPYLGSKISLITTSDIRYEGILFTLNREESTIAVQNVRSFGTEGRRCPEVPMSNEIYDFIIFRGKDLKDLTVLQGAPEQAQAPMSQAPPTGYMSGGTDYLENGRWGGSSMPARGSQGGFSQHVGAQSWPGDGGHQYGTPNQSYGNHMGSMPGNHGSMGSSAGAFGRPSAPSATRNGYGSPSNSVSPCSGGLGAAQAAGAPGYQPGSSASRPGPTMVPPEKAPYSQANHSRPSYSPPEGIHVPPPHSQVEPRSIAPPSLTGYEEGNGVPSSRGPCDFGKSAEPPRTPLGEEPGSFKGGVPPGVDGKGRGKGGAQKKPLVEVLRYHKRAEETIVKAMRSQGSANISPQELRAMSEISPAVYHFYLDFVNYCCPSHLASSDEQQWESLCKALKKHFEKDFGSSVQNQKPAVPQRPNNTLGDFITITADPKVAKKAPKVTRPGPPPPGRSVGRGKKEEQGFTEDASYSEDPSGQSWSCPRCTLRNETNLMECAACGTSKQQAALWAEFPPLG